MPIVDLNPLPLGTPIDTPKGFVVTPGQDDIDHGSEKPDFTKTLGAAFKQDNTVGSYFASDTRGSPDFREDGYNPWKSIEGTKYEPHFKSFGSIRNSVADAAMKRQIDQEDETRKTLEAAPFWHSFPAQLAAGVIDLPTLLPGGAFVRGAKGGFALGKSAVVVGGAAGLSTAAQELALQSINETRPGTESAINIGASVVLGGLLGAGGAKLLSKAEWNSATAAIERQVTDFNLTGKTRATAALEATDKDHARQIIADLWSKGTLTPEQDATVERYVRLNSSDESAAYWNDPKVINTLVDASKQFRAPTDIVVFRGAADASTSLRPKELFTPTSLSKAWAETMAEARWSHPSIERILIKRGTPIIPVHKGDGNEFEILLPSNTGMKLLNESSPGAYRLADGSDAIDDWVVRGLEAFDERQPVAVQNSGLTSAGAAASEPGDIVGNSIAGRMAGAVAAASRPLNPLLRALQSPSAAMRDITTKLVENSVYLKKNMDGVASEPAVETLMKEWNGGLAKAVTMSDQAFMEHIKAGGDMTSREFREAVGKAMRRGDEDETNPFVSKVAKEWRAKVFDPLKQAAIEAKLLPEDVSVETAASYFSRMWNRNKLIAREGEFKQIVTDYYANAIGKEYQKASESLIGRTAKLDQELADLNLPPEQRLATLGELDVSLKNLHEGAGGLVDVADQLSDATAKMRAARKAGDDAGHAAAKAEADKIKETGGDDLKAFIAKRSELKGRQRNVDLGTAGLLERSDKILGSLADLEEANHRAMERLVKKGQKLERDLDRLDADALEERITALATSYGDVAKKAEAAAERAEKAIANIRAAGERGAEKNTKDAQRAATEALTGPPEEVAAKRAAAAEATAKTRAKRTAADQAIEARLTKEAEQQRGRAERIDKIAQRLEAARDFDHDGLMAELKNGIDKAMRETSAASMARGERAARLGERLADLDPARVQARAKVIAGMKVQAELAFRERWEVKNLGEGVGTSKPDFSQAARDIADSAHATLAGRVDGGSRPEFLKITTRGPMKDRTLNIPDALIEDFLEHDVDLVGRRYARVMGADVEIARKFGSVDMVDQLQKIRDDYAKMRSGISDEKELTKIAASEKSDIGDIEALRDLLRGTRQESPIERSYSRIVRAANHLNYIRSMGEVVLASITDAVRPAMVHGLGQFMATLPQLTSNMKAVKLSVNEAQLAGNVSERVLGHRLATISDIIDPYASRGPVEAFLENMTNIGSKWNGIRIWTDMMKSFASVMTQNRILSGIEKFAEIKPSEKAYLAYLGVDQGMAGRILKQFSENGETLDGVKVANTEKWTDPVVVRAYRAAMNKDVDSIIVQKSVADVPLFASTPTGKLLLQFKSFALASHQRVLLRGLQEDQSRFIGGTIAMTGMGMLITYLKAISGNRPETREKALKNPGWWIGEGLDRSGILSVPMELANTFEKASGFNPIKTPIKAMDDASQMSQKNQNRSDVGSLLGPTVGMAGDVMTAMPAIKNLIQGEEITKGQKGAAERLLPYNSYMGLRQFIRYGIAAD